MDFAKYDLRAASERGSWVHLTHNGQPLYLDDDADEPKKSCRVRVLGMAAKGVLEAFRRVERVQALKSERLSRTKVDHADSVIAKFQDDLEEAMENLISTAVAEWENIVWNGDLLDCNSDNVLKICGPGTLFFGQVNSAITEEHRLFTNADSD